MKIDLFTFCAQIANFIILVLLLKKILFKRIAAAMDERERGIAAKVAAAEENIRRSREEAEAARSLHREALERRESELAAATADAASSRLRMESEAREQVGIERKAWFEALKQEERTLTEEIARRSGSIMLAVLRKMLVDLADESLEDRIIGHFIKKIASEKNNGFSARGECTVTSGFVLSDAQKAQIRSAIEAPGKTPSAVRFAVDPGIVCGIELTGNGLRIAWHIGEYLEKIKEAIPFPLEART